MIRGWLFGGSGRRDGEMKQQEALAGTRKYFARYLKADLLIIDDMGINDPGINTHNPLEMGGIFFSVDRDQARNRASGDSG